MTYYSSKDVAYVFIDYYNVAVALDTVRMKVAAVTQEFQALGTTFPQALDTGTRQGELEMSGLYDGAGPATALGPPWMDGTNRVVSVLLEGNTVSKRFYGFQAAKIDTSEVGVAADQMHSQATTFSVSGEVNHGYVVAPLAARTTGANTDLTYADLGADAATAHCFLHVTSVTLGGSTNCIVTLRDSNDHITFADAQAFAAVTGSGSWVVNTTTLEQYLSVSWAWTGAGAGQTIGFFVGVAVD